MGHVKRVGLLALALAVVIAVGVAAWTLLPSPFSSPISPPVSSPNPPSSDADGTADNAHPSSPSESASRESTEDAGSTTVEASSSGEAASPDSGPSTEAGGSTESEAPDAPNDGPDQSGTVAPSAVQTASEEPPTDSADASSASSGSASSPSPSSDASGNAAQPPGLVEQGRLALQIDGRQFSTETYDLTRTAEGTYVLDSEGTFSVPVMVADVSFNYAQTIRLASTWQPRAYVFDLSGPLGFGNRHIDAQFSDGSARVSRGGSEEPTSFQLARDRAAVVGMLASYTLLPKLIGDDQAARLSAMVVSFRGEDGPGEGNLSTVPVKVERAGTARIRPANGDEPIDVTHLTLTFNAPSAGDESAPLDIYIQGDRFLALHGRFSEESSPFRIYDLERFPNGFETLTN